MKKQICLGIVAHVDAGKTTLSESILYKTDTIRSLGRVDNQDAFLDTHELERARGITIFSKQAVFQLGDQRITLLDTPGHVDFSAEMERTLQVLDYAILVISGADGVQGHTETLWKLLTRYKIPVFLFVNKMDQQGTDEEALMAELKKRLDDRCVDFCLNHTSDEFLEEVVVNDEKLMEQYLECGKVADADIIRLIAERKIFPCYFGSALKLKGVEEFLEGLKTYMQSPAYGETFGAKVFKISRDEQNNRLTWMKITGGSLKVRDLLTGRSLKSQEKTEDEQEEERTDWEEKVNQIRVYSGTKYEVVNEAFAGMVCAVTGLTKTWPGEGLGEESVSDLPLLEPVLTYRIRLPRDCDPVQMVEKLKLLEEEEPELHIAWNKELREIQALLMGEVQIEILKALILERFGVSVDFDEGRIVYKETIANTVEGVGHFEPLRHYAEVHLILEPGERGSGMQFAANCSEDILDKNWQRLVLTHLEERVHRGVLMGCEVTDMRITLVSGRAHIKHTEGGDFRQATYRAVRQGLMQAESVLLEPYYAFRLEVPAETVGRAMTDLEKMYGQFEQPELEGEFSILTGIVPVSTMRNYQHDVTSYTKGRGHLMCTLDGYGPCHNTEEVLSNSHYDPELDVRNPPDSVFCSHGAGTIVPWYMVPQFMHVESYLSPQRKVTLEEMEPINMRRSVPMAGSEEEEKELEEIFTRTFGAIKPRVGEESRRPVRTAFGEAAKKEKPYVYKPKERLPEYLLVDGYNVIFSWDELSALAKTNVNSAREKLMDILSNYQGYRKCNVILVFDAYRVEGHAEEVLKYHNIYVVYTKEAETADQYIERTAHAMNKKYQVTVATSDGTEQIIIRGQNGILMSSRELKAEIERIEKEIRTEYVEQHTRSKNYLFDYLSEDAKAHIEKMQQEEE